MAKLVSNFGFCQFVRDSNAAENASLVGTCKTNWTRASCSVANFRAVASGYNGTRNGSKFV